MTLTTAPVIDRLSDLGHDWRHVASKSGTTAWHGDLVDYLARTRYLRMLDQGVIHCVQHRDGEVYRVFAAVHRQFDPAIEHAKAIWEQNRAAELSRQQTERIAQAIARRAALRADWRESPR